MAALCAAGRPARLRVGEPGAIFVGPHGGMESARGVRRGKFSQYDQDGEVCHLPKADGPTANVGLAAEAGCR